MDNHKNSSTLFVEVSVEIVITRSNLWFLMYFDSYGEEIQLETFDF